MHSSHISLSTALCSNPVGIDSGMVTFSGSFIDNTATYSCDSGFELVGVTSTTCTQVDANSASFTPAPPFCRREYFVNETELLCAFLVIVSPKEQPIQYIALNLVIHGLHLSFSTALCSDPVDIDNGSVAFTGNSVGDTASYTCNSGFELIGNVITTCTQVDANSAVFQPAPPFCRREYSNHRLPIVVTSNFKIEYVNRTRCAAIS